ncbi:MAG: alpha/beta hydrolase [Oscillospiraceae bacterium]|nr:alpha/beta hydrolase [Oscillospiraceae bacterium]
MQNYFLHKAGDAAAPIIFLLTGDEDGTRVWDIARQLTARPFSLVTVPVTDWNRELSPWAAQRVFKRGEDFSGGADTFLQALECKIVPAVRAEAQTGAPCVIAGYSLAGLCAVYAAYRTKAFSGVISASGSLWFPGFSDYIASHDFARRPERVYFSLGDRESKTKHPLMSRVEDDMRAICDAYAAQGIETRFERNPGNHFQDAELRLAKGVAWMLEK